MTIYTVKLSVNGMYFQIQETSKERAADWLAEMVRGIVAKDVTFSPTTLLQVELQEGAIGAIF